ncbi:MAG TPA: hypothetical protein V6D15_10535 [Oculatellaceae cyanobacterium]|jgi:hypothetical protein
MYNQNSNVQSINDAIASNENGEIVVKDLKLAEELQELSKEELDAIAAAGGCDGGGNCCGGYHHGGGYL